MTETSSDAQAGITRVDHVAVAVSSMSEALQTWQTLLDKESPEDVSQMLWDNLVGPVMNQYARREESQRAKTLLGVARY